MNEMKKKITALLLTIAMFVSMMVPAYALDTADTTDISDDPKVTLVNLSTKITTQELDKIMDSVGAKMVMKDGTVIPIDCVVTVEDVTEEISPVSQYSASSEKSYRVTVQADATDKTSDDKGKQSGSDYDISATLKMTWTDGSGTNNILKDVSGTLTVVKGTVSSGQLRWGDGMTSALIWAKRDVGAKSSFSYSPNFPAVKPSADYSVQMKTSESFSNPLYLYVSSSIFQ